MTNSYLKLPKYEPKNLDYLNKLVYLYSLKEVYVNVKEICAILDTNDGEIVEVSLSNGLSIYTEKSKIVEIYNNGRLIA